MFYRLPEFNYYRPTTLREALYLLSELEDAKVLAGGTDLLIDLRIRRYRPKNIIDISRLKELKYIIDEGDKVRIGSLTTLQELIESPIIKSIGIWRLLVVICVMLLLLLILHHHS